MSFFGRPFYAAPEASFTPLFRLLDDFDSYSREASNGTSGHQHQHRRHGAAARSFNPRFDVRETAEAYELHGELAGLARENVSIEFTEPQTLVIRGRVERSYASGTPPAAAGAVEGDKTPAALTEAGESVTEGQATPSSSSSHRATVEDEEAEKAKEEGSQEVVKAADEAPATQAAPAAPREKYWVSERSTGEFSRTFTFPGRVDQEAVSANLQNGILSVVVPKAKKVEARRIAIN